MPTEIYQCIASEIAEQVKALSGKSDDLSWTTVW